MVASSAVRARRDRRERQRGSPNRHEAVFRHIIAPDELAQIRRRFGRGVHGDAPARLTLSPAEAGTGVVFVTRDGDNPIAAHWTNVRSTRLRTEIGSGAARVSTVEHLMAAFAGLGVDNALVEIDESEVPAVDGSALPFVAAIRDAGIARLRAARRVIKIVETVRVSDGALVEFAPTNRGRLDLDVEIAFPGAVGWSKDRLAARPVHFRARNRVGAQLWLSAGRRAAFGARGWRCAPRSKTASFSTATACSIRAGCAFRMKWRATKCST